MLRVKTSHGEVLRCRADAGRSEGAGAAQVEVASGPAPGFRPGPVRMSWVRAHVGRGQEGLWNVPGAAPSLSFAPRRHRGGRGLGSRAICCARLPSLGAPMGSAASCLPASPGGIHLN